MNAASSFSTVEPDGPRSHTLGGFRLLHEIGCGGMATVYLGYRAHEAGVRQLAAVKVIHPHQACEESFVDMFLDEARIVSHIDHPNVCRLRDFGNADGTYYLAMDYVMGETWADITARIASSSHASKIAIPFLTQVLVQACEGLHAAHEATDAHGNHLRIVHRDVSPHNIMVGYDGSVRVLDFGIASANDRLHCTQIGGAVKGRLSYMAPEQMRGLLVDRRSDVWSLGVLLWEGLAGHRLFPESNDAKIMRAVMQEPLASLSDSDRPIPDALQKIVEKALQRERDERFESARDFGLALSRFAMRTNTALGTVELSEFMHRLFTDRIEQKRTTLREAVEGRDEPETTVRGAPQSTATQSQDLTYEAATRQAFSSGIRARTQEPLRSTGVPRLLRATGLTAAALVLFAVHEGDLREASLRGARLTSSIAAEIDQRDSPHTGAAARANKMGSIRLITPDARAAVYLGSRRLGTTPLKLSLPVGQHTLQLRGARPGSSVTRRVTVKSGTTPTLRVSMK